MLSFFFQIALLWRTMVRGLRQDAEFRALSILLALALIGGTLFYWTVQHWTVLDSLYFCVMTIATIGYGDLAPTGPVSKVFTIAYAILGIGLFASFVGKLVALRMEHHKQQKENRLRDKKDRLDRSRNK